MKLTSLTRSEALMIAVVSSFVFFLSETFSSDSAAVSVFPECCWTNLIQNQQGQGFALTLLILGSISKSPYQGVEYF